MTAPIQPEEALPLHGVRVLVAENDPASAKLAMIVLSDAGAEVALARGAAEVLSALPTFRPQLLLLDLVLADGDGLSLVQLLKADEQNRALAIVIVSAHNGPTATRNALAAGCLAYMTKPIDTETFAADLARHLGITP